MKSNLLHEGDLVRLEKGMMVHAPIPEKFRYGGSFSEQIHQPHICIGEVCRKEAADKEHVLEEMLSEIRKRLSDYDDKVVTNEIFQAFVNSLGLNLSTEEFDTSMFAGIYRVYEAKLTEDTSLPSSSENWTVYCEKVNEPDVRVWFYQNGCHVATLHNIEPIGHIG